MAKIAFILDVVLFCLQSLLIAGKGMLDYLTIVVDYFYFPLEFCQFLLPVAWSSLLEVVVRNLKKKIDSYLAMSVIHLKDYIIFGSK